jgi:hypothetical protein
MAGFFYQFIKKSLLFLVPRQRNGARTLRAGRHPDGRHRVGRRRRRAGEEESAVCRIAPRIRGGANGEGDECPKCPEMVQAALN